MKINIIFFLLFLFSSIGYSQSELALDKAVLLTIEGKKYEQLQLRVSMDEGENVNIAGRSIDAISWAFPIPDSIYCRSKGMTLCISQTDSTRHQIYFRMLDITSLNIGSFLFTRGSTLNLVFKETTVEEKASFFRFRDVTTDIFEVSSKEDIELTSMVEMMNTGYSLFNMARNDSLSYAEQIDKYINFTKEHPNSHSLISTLASKLAFYESKEDISRVFNCFSEEMKQSYYGKKINKYLTNIKFANIELPTWNSYSKESIIMDSTKYNLIIFSASWCAPCHLQTPILKEIYQDLKANLNLTYISFDEEKSIEAWGKLMKDQEIPWRSLMAVGDIARIKDKYSVQGIPHSILVHTDLTMEVLDVRKEHHKKRLYDLIKP